MELVRGTQASFEATFVDVTGTPMVRADPENYPQVTIRDPDSSIVSTGVGNPIGNGKYRFNWYVPKTADINTEDESWRIDWVFITANGHTKQASQTFDIVDKIESSAEERAQTILVDAGESARLSIRWPTKPYSITMDFRSSTGSVLWSVDGVATNDAESDPNNPNRLISETVVNGEYVYYFDTDALTEGEYQVAWNIRDSLVSNITKEIQLVRVAPGIFWHYATEIKTLIDKLQKRSGIVQAYTASDLYSYVKSGLDIVNFYAPTTNWTLGEIPLTGSRGVRTAVLMASAVYALTAQQILEIEISFNHSGQTVTLDYNHDYSGVASALQLQLDKFAEAKPQIFRLANGAAFSGGRAKTYRFTGRVFKLDGNMRGIAPSGAGGAWRTIGL